MKDSSLVQWLIIPQLCAERVMDRVGQNINSWTVQRSERPGPFGNLNRSNNKHASIWNCCKLWSWHSEEFPTIFLCWYESHVLLGQARSGRHKVRKGLSGVKCLGIMHRVKLITLEKLFSNFYRARHVSCQPSVCNWSG